MSLIESYGIEEAGFHPFLIRDSWQVAKLNYKEEYHIDNLNKLTKHQNSDRAVALLSGNAVLIVRDEGDNKDGFHMVLMERGTSYNVPKSVGYAIAMEEGCELFIVEKPNTHRDDVIDCPLTEAQLEAIRKKLNVAFKKNNL